jgi:hypothetical protein
MTNNRSGVLSQLGHVGRACFFMPDIAGFQQLIGFGIAAVNGISE